jgi:ribosomal protein L37AE/L43A
MRNINTDSESYILKESNVVKNLTSYSQSPKRKRKCCPLCDSIRIARRTRKGGYVCSDCLKTFNIPSAKLSTVGGRLPAFLLARPEVQA